MQDPSARLPGLSIVPVDIQELIAFYAATSDPFGPPAALIPLLLTCKSLNNALSRTSSPHLYARIFRQQFDYAALVRRFPSEERTAQHLSEELVRRWETLGRVRRLERVQTAEPDLWVLYLMCIENDGRNLDQLINYADLPTYLQRFRKERLSPPILSTHGTFERLSQELPSETTDRALALWIDWYTSGVTDYCKESSNERASALQMLRLYVFAAQRFDCYFVPWTHLELPLPGSYLAQDRTVPTEPQLSPFLADLTPRSRAVAVPCLGQQTVRLLSPLAAHAALLSFFSRVETDPALSGTEGGGPVARHPAEPPTTASSGRSAGPSPRRVGVPTSSFGVAAPNGTKKSEDFDDEWRRMTLCIEPVLRGVSEKVGSAGLGVWATRGMFEGTWGGSFAFMDFDSYRDMLSGQSRAIYEGPYSFQPQVWRLKETLVRRPASIPSPASPDYDPTASTTGSPLNAGFPAGWTVPTRTDDAEILTGVPGYTLVSAEEERNLREKGETERLEIIVTGTGHSAWGKFYISGRVRVWDGLAILTKEYYPDSRGKWLYRGYVVAGGAIVGRWRDTFTPENYCGYEGSFHMKRREE